MWLIIHILFTLQLFIGYLSKYKVNTHLKFNWTQFFACYEKPYFHKRNIINKKKINSCLYCALQVQEARIQREASYRVVPSVSTRLRDQRAERREQEEERLQDIHYVLLHFAQKLSEIPCCTCCVCNRFRFRSQVQKFTSNKYQNYSNILHMCVVDINILGQWICTKCHQSLIKGKLPALSVIGNNLKPIAMPGSLDQLNTLEQFLITPVLPFMKIISLPKGSQRGMHGPVVCVASDVNTTVGNLPRTIDDGGLIKVKLKRKLAYRGHHLYQQVRMNLVADALRFLKQHHPDVRGTLPDNSCENIVSEIF